MKLLVFTQKVNRLETSLGFFHQWIVEISKNFESVIVICLEKGEYDLPNNVKVLSLGKEVRRSKIMYVRNFFRYIWSERNNYDGVFIHMNQEYAILGGLLWKILGKRVAMWRNHYAGSWKTDLAAACCDIVFCTSKYSYTAKYKKTKFMPVGVNTDFFKSENNSRIPNSILSLGRIAESKKLHILIESLNRLKLPRKSFTASIYGSPLSPGDEKYLASLKDLVSKYEMNDQIKFYSGIPNEQTPQVYSSHELFVNLSPSGMYDKTIFEAMACGTIVVACNRDLQEFLDEKYLFKDDNIEELSNRLGAMLALSDTEKESSRGIMRSLSEKQSLRILAQKIRSYY